MKVEILSDFLCKCFVVKLERLLLVRLYDKSAIFYSAENAHAYESGHMASGHFVLAIWGETFFASSIIAYWPLAVSMPPTKVCLQCKALYLQDERHVNAVILSFDSNEKQIVICEREHFNYETYGSSRI